MKGLSYVLYGKVVFEDRIEDPGMVEVTNGVITYAGPADRFHSHYTDLSNHFICPGFIDVHLHAVDGYDFMDGDFSSFKKIQQSLPQYGVTCFLATSRTASYDEIYQFLLLSNKCINTETKGAELLGVHLEGPWINSSFSGAQRPEFILNPNRKLAEEWVKTFSNLIKIVTLAPELPESLETIRLLNSSGVTVSAGHTNASHEDMNLAIKAGLKNVTHCFNAMSPFHHRKPGAAFSALFYDQLNCELIADGLHVHKDVIKFLYKVKTADKIILISDCTGANRLEDGRHSLRNKEICKKGKKISLANGTLAGSAITLNEAVRYLIVDCNIPIHEVIKMASLNPAKATSIYKRKGKIEAGYDADLVILNESYEVMRTIINGKVAYEKRKVKYN